METAKGGVTMAPKRVKRRATTDNGIQNIVDLAAKLNNQMKEDKKTLDGYKKQLKEYAKETGEFTIEGHDHTAVVDILDKLSEPSVHDAYTAIEEHYGENKAFEIFSGCVKILVTKLNSAIGKDTVEGMRVRIGHTEKISFK